MPGCGFPADGCFQDFKERGVIPLHVAFRAFLILVPIGAIYTIDDLEARELANILKPKVVIPMHYKTPKLKLELCPLAPFIDAAKDCRIHNLNDCEATITKMSLGEDRVLILRPYDAERDE